LPLSCIPCLVSPVLYPLYCIPCIASSILYPLYCTTYLAPPVSRPLSRVHQGWLGSLSPGRAQLPLSVVRLLTHRFDMIYLVCRRQLHQRLLAGPTTAAVPTTTGTITLDNNIIGRALTQVNKVFDLEGSYFKKM